MNVCTRIVALGPSSHGDFTVWQEILAGFNLVVWQFSGNPAN